MAEKWQIHKLSLVLNSCTDCLLTLLVNFPKGMICIVLMIFWRAWHIHNEVVHDKKPPLVEVSQHFLLSHMESLLMIKHHHNENITKGKFILDGDERYFHTLKDQEHVNDPPWNPPSEGWCKLNTNGSFGAGVDASAGMIVRDPRGDIILSSCHLLLFCRDAWESELFAVKEGLSLALQYCNKPLLIETDCLEIVKLLRKSEVDRSVYTMVIEDIKALMKVHCVCITHDKRCQNINSHYLANYARTNAHTAVWLASDPEGLSSTLHIDCNPEFE
jgi:hypothetical protein